MTVNDVHCKACRDLFGNSFGKGSKMIKERKKSVTPSQVSLGLRGHTIVCLRPKAPLFLLSQVYWARSS